ncbi:TetR/AcrR family transcriptional regulator [Xylophilus sp.]|uniref:TetR/AcrR family transcriptional regulator n=1 Tax=Xylophilus sp. TaxID=2653893 RepID=UPI0013B6C485|nr:TetR/AcrR family transcriptional regulator [Xylophilus sp.]KAF1046739.1 MAG: hypothetical protein GAK38_02302 [Xylophilus sp.]
MTADLSPKAEEIARHTTALLASGGYNSFSYADLAERVGIRKASIHHHFASKATLVRVVVAQYRQQATAALAQLSGHLGDPAAELQAYADHWVECIRTGDTPFCICGMLATELPTLPDEVAVEVRGHFRDLTDWVGSVLTRGAARGQFHFSGTPKSAAQSFVSVVYGAMLLARALGDPAVFQSTVQSAIQALLAPPR